MGKRIIAQRKGKSTLYRAPSHRYKRDVRYPKLEKGTAVVEAILHDPAHTAPLARVRFEDGSKDHLLSAEGLNANQAIQIGKGDVEVGNILPLESIPEGTKVFNIEKTPGDGGKFIRASGSFGTIRGKGARVSVLLPSGKLGSFNPRCRATVGVVAGGGRREQPFGKAGKKALAFGSKAFKYPKVSGVAMNPVDHPHGGGGHQHVGKHTSVPRSAPPGRKVGDLRPKRKGKGK